jgi:hypothetical protein
MASVVRGVLFSEPLLQEKILILRPFNRSSAALADEHGSTFWIERDQEPLRLKASREMFRL